MGNYNSTTARTDIENDISQTANNSCASTSSDVFSNNTVIGQNIDFEQILNVPFSCAMTNTFDATVSNVVTDSIKQSATTENGIIFPSFGSNTNIANVSENIRNSITQIMNNTCVYSASNVATGNMFVAKGDIKVIQSIDPGSATSCTITNTASASASNVVSNTVSQTAAITNALTTIILILVVGSTVAAVAKFGFASKAGASNTFDTAGITNLFKGVGVKSGAGDEGTEMTTFAKKMV